MSAPGAVFLDRDGTLIEDVGYISDPALVRLEPGAAGALRALRDAGWKLAVVSNQSGIGRGWVTQEQADAVHRRFLDELAAAGASVDDVSYCPHAPDAGCSCRKPLPGLILDAARRLRVDPAKSFMVGNSRVDMEAGRAAGCRTIAIGAEPGVSADWTASSWSDVVGIVLAEREAA